MFTLLILFQLKHFLADYPLQFEFMLGKFKDKGWFLPLFWHAFVHSVFTYHIVGIFLIVNNSPNYSYTAFACMLIDLVAHFVIDRVKASPKMLGRFKALSALEWKSLNVHPSFTDKDRSDAKRSNKYFWWSLGADQMAHHLTHYLIIYLTLRALTNV